MTISFFEPGDVPQPPEKTKIEHLSAVPSEDGWRVKVEIHITPFQVRPSLEMALVKHNDDNETQVASFSIVETMHPKMEFTMHVRGIDDPLGNYTLRTVLYYRESPEEGAESLEPMAIQDKKDVAFEVPAEEQSL